MQIQLIPLSKLKPSPKNVRKTAGSVDDLVASIRAHGLQQNLTVECVNGHYEVVAGGRRLRALQRLEELGELPVDLAEEGILCNIADAAVAGEASLAENVVRHAMHPADEFQAYSELQQREQLTNAEIATRYGTTEKHVEQRMRLARVAPSIIKEYREGKANLDQVMALAVVDDQAEQQKVWKGAKGYKAEPRHLREALLSREVDVNSGLGKFVTVKAYKAAGGTVHEDLFSDTVTLPDAALVKRLVTEKLQPEADKLKAKGWGWVEVRPTFNYQDKSKFRQRYDVKPGPAFGAVVSVNEYNGSVEITTGLMKPGAKDATKPRSGGVGVPAKFKYRETIAQLLGIRTGVIRKALRDDPELAVKSLAASMAADYLGLLPKRDRTTEPVTKVIEAGAVGTTFFPAQLAGIKQVDPDFDKAGNTWGKRLVAGVKQHGSVLAWLLHEPEDVTYDLLAFLAVEGVDAGGNNPDDDKQVQLYCKTIGVDLGRSWSVTKDWLAKQPREYLLHVAVDAGGKGTDKALAKLKGKALVDRVYQLLEEKEWEPPQLRPLPEPKPAKTPKKPTTKAAKKPGKAKPAKKAAPRKSAVPAPLM